MEYWVLYTRWSNLHVNFIGVAAIYEDGVIFISLGRAFRRPCDSVNLGLFRLFYDNVININYL